MSFLLIMIVGIVIIVMPVKFAAQFVGAGRTGFWMCLIAVIVVSVLDSMLGGFITNRFAHFVVSLAVSGGIYMMILDTTYMKGIGISLIQLLLLIVLALIVAALFAGA